MCRIAFAILFLSLSAVAQAPTATLQGTVVDTTGAAVANATITVIRDETGTRRNSQTDASGQFTLANLGVGSWRLIVEAPGFETADAGVFPLSIGQLLIRRVQLQLAGAKEHVDVTERPEAIDTAASTASIALGSERVEEAPARSRNYLNFVLAAPAVATSAGSSSQRTMTGVRAPLADTGFTFGGVRPRNNSVQIDGMDNRDETTGGNRVAVGLEMVRSVRAVH